MLKYFSPILTLLLISGAASASPLNYTPINPNFGGNPNNGAFLMEEATDNNHFKGLIEYNPTTPPLTPAQQIVQQITDSVLSNVASQISSQIYGENSKNSGSYQVGNSTVSFEKQGQSILLSVTDNQGGVTEVTIPTPTL